MIGARISFALRLFLDGIRIMMLTLSGFFSSTSPYTVGTSGPFPGFWHPDPGPGKPSIVSVELLDLQELVFACCCRVLVLAFVLRWG